MSKNRHLKRKIKKHHLQTLIKHLMREDLYNLAKILREGLSYLMTLKVNSLNRKTEPTPI